jgi:hypothetical protein
MYALRSAESKRQYPKRFKVFLDFLKLEGTFEEQAKEFLRQGKLNPNWAMDSIIRFVTFEIERAERGEIAESTISNYYKATKLFCEMNDLTLSWKKIARGIPRGRRAANSEHPVIIDVQPPAAKVTRLPPIAQVYERVSPLSYPNSHQNK